MPRITTLFSILFATGVLAFSAYATGEQAAPDGLPERPNILLILADDLGYGDPGSYNNASQIPTPHIDRLARQGIRFTDAHTPSSVCTPTRYGLLTGRYAWRTHLDQGVLLGYDPLLIDTSRVTLASLLKAQGYRTGGVGKWHLGLGDEERTDYGEPLRPGPVSLGFDYYFGIPASLDFEPYLYFENARVLEAPTDSTPGNSDCCFGPFWRAGAMAPSFEHDEVLPTFAERAVAFIERAASAQEPFFLYVPLAAPHTPWLPLEPYKGKSGAGEYGDFVYQVDDAVGRILEALEQTGETEHTLVIFTSDNGAIWSEELIEETEHRANGPLRGQKADIWEGGHRIPFIACWPGQIPAGAVSDEVLSLTDLLATLAELTAAELPEGAGEDSYSMLPALVGERYEGPIREATVHHSGRGMFAIRQGEWKLAEGRGSGGFTEPRHLEPGPGEPEGQLYNLAEDPAERRNLYAERPEVVRRLRALLEQYRQQGYSRPM